MSNDRLDRNAIDKANETKAEQRLKMEAEQAQFKNDCTELLNNPTFIRYISKVLAKGEIMSTVMTGNSQTYYKSGRQDFAREIWKDFLVINQEKAIKLMIPKGDF